MDDQIKQPIAQEAYDALADSYAVLIDTKPHNAYYERPATLSLLPDVKGKQVLDVGCGPGVYAEWLVDHGAQVIAFDANSKMVELARARLGGKATIVLANLEQPLDFLVDNSFDIVVCPLVLDYVRDWRAVFEKFWRVLRSGGYLVFSMEHPYDKFHLHESESNYFDVELVEYEWTGFGQPVRVPSYRRSMSAVIEPLVAAGFALDRILEPIPTKEFREKLPEDYERLARGCPAFMCIRAIKSTHKGG